MPDHAGGAPLWAWPGREPGSGAGASSGTWVFSLLSRGRVLGTGVFSPLSSGRVPGTGIFHPLSTGALLDPGLAALQGLSPPQPEKRRPGFKASSWLFSPAL